MALVLKALLVLLFLVALAFGASWLGFVPPRFGPLSPLSLEERGQWFVDLKLAALRHNPILCRSVLKGPYVDATPIPDNSKNGCGWINSVTFTKIGGANMNVWPLTCEMTAALALWVAHEVQPAAVATFRSSVRQIDHMGSYNCRAIEGKNRLSEHASANAIDISGFTLDDGRHISVLDHWKGQGTKTKFLRRVYRPACRYFRVTLGPDYNPAHADHFHFDRSLFWSCN